MNDLLLLSAKPVIYLVNLSIKDYQRKANKWLAKIKAWVDAHGADPLIPLSVLFEQELADAPSAEARAAKCAELACNSALPKIITTGYHRLNLVHFFTAGEDEVRCWTVRKGTKAVRDRCSLCVCVVFVMIRFLLPVSLASCLSSCQPQAAGTIHTDFEKGFICANTIAYDDFFACGSEAECRNKGKLRIEGKNYTVQDGGLFVIILLLLLRAFFFVSLFLICLSSSSLFLHRISFLRRYYGIQM